MQRPRESSESFDKTATNENEAASKRDIESAAEENANLS